MKPLALTLYIVTLAASIACIPLSSSAQQDIHGWYIACKLDAFLNKRSCMAFKGHLVVSLGDDGSTYISVDGPSDRYPGSTVYLRIDDILLSTEKSGWYGIEAEGIIKLITEAKKIITQYTNRPNEHLVDHEMTADGFSEVMTYLTSAVHSQ